MLLVFAPAVVFGQYIGNPVKKDRLVRELRSKQLQTRDIVQVINEHGVDFKLTPAVENELIAAGARPSVIEAVRSNYRYVKPVKANSVAANNKSAANKPPLSKNVIVTLLQNNISDSNVRKQVKENGVNFQLNEKISKEIKDAGGSNDLIKLISSNYNPAASAANKKPLSKDYDDLIQEAVEAYDNRKDLVGALEALRQAAKLSPNKPRAYQLLGYLHLYGFKSLTEAEKNWRLAISYGGSAVIRVIHDHNATFTNTCEGSLYIARDTVRFESDNNRHTFETTDRNIKKVEVNSRFKRLIQLKGGSFKIVLHDAREDDDKKFSFAPLSGDTDESKMIISLIGKNK